MSADAPVPHPRLSVATPPPGRRPVGQRRELRTADGRVFHIGDAVLYHASVGPEYPLWTAWIDAIVERAGGVPVLVLHLDDHEGARLPDASIVHLDARPLPGCGWCAARKGQGLS